MRAIWGTEDQVRDTCPVCGGLIVVESSCPGYGPPGKVMVCWPTWECGNAMEYTCVGKEDDDEDTGCGWWYRDPPGCRGDVTDMGPEPAWLGKYQVPPHDDFFEGE